MAPVLGCGRGATVAALVPVLPPDPQQPAYPLSPAGATITPESHVPLQQPNEPFDAEQGAQGQWERVAVPQVEPPGLRRQRALARGAGHVSGRAGSMTRWRTTPSRPAANSATTQAASSGSHWRKKGVKNLFQMKRHKKVPDTFFFVRHRRRRRPAPSGAGRQIELRPVFFSGTMAWVFRAAGALR